MPVAVGAIIGGIVDAVSTAAAAVGTGIEAVGAALAPEAVAGEAAAGAAEAGIGAAIPTSAEAAATAGEIAAAGGGIALPTIEEVGTLGGVLGGAGTEAALGGGAAAALAGGGLAGGEALAAGGGLAGGVLGGAELASLLGGGTTAGLTGGALPGAIPVPTEGVSNVAQNLGTPAPVARTPAAAPGVPLGSSTAGGVPADVLSGTTGPLSALQPQNTPFETLWQQSGAAGLPPSTDLSAVQPSGSALSLAPETTSFPPTNPLTNFPATAADTAAFANAPAATPGEIPFSTALNMQEPATEAALAGTGTLTPADTATVAGQTVPPIPFTSAGPGGVPAAAPAAPTITDIQGAGVGAEGGLPSGTSLTGGGGISGAASNLLSGSTLRTLGLVAPLGALGLTLARGPQPLPSAEQAAVANVGPGSPIANVAGSQLTEGATGQLTTGQTAQVNKYVSDAKNQLYQLYARMGRDPTNDTDYIQGLAQIDQNAQIMTQQFITAAINNGIAAQGVIDSTLQAAANLQVQQDEAFRSSIASATQAFGLTAALTAATSRA